ncbi:MAG: IS1634 family transposase [Tannerellaceae bacterium]|jgi:transposase|nr:IS1634 family transposase [Tannerellaceae bacterium]
MFVRKKKNRSGSASVVVTDKRNGTFKEVKTIGVSSEESEIEKLYQQGKTWISSYLGERDMFAEHTRKQEEKQVTERLLGNIENILLNGTQLILNHVFKLVGFDKIDDEILKHLVISRICQPRSKVATVDYLKSYFDEDVELHKIYRYLDKLHGGQKDTVQQISVAHTRRILGGKIGLVFYDVTTLYFETDYADELRKTGFSKDGKHAQPQIVLGLLVSAGGYPLAYSIHEGNKYEGHTMLPVVGDFVKKFKLKDFVVVADSGLMNNENITLLETKQYKYIIGARIKNESKPITKWLLSLERGDGKFYEYQKTATSRLIAGYSENRAKKDHHNREKGIKRLEKEYKSGLITKDKVNKRGYNKFLEISDNIKATINYDKIREDECWDGWKGYITNTTMTAKTVYEQYGELWQVERAFRITKGTLELRPMFHFTKKRIEAHVCICFVAYKVYKEPERILKTGGINLSVDKVLDIARTITTLKIKLPISNETMTKTMLLTPRHKSISILFDENFWKAI